MAQDAYTPTGELEFSDLDRHFGALMMRLAGRADTNLGFAAALVSRATSNGDVCVRLADFKSAEADSLDAWVGTLRDSSVVGAPGEFRPLVLDEQNRLYLYRYWDYEKRLADNLLGRAGDIA